MQPQQQPEQSHDKPTLVSKHAAQHDPEGEQKSPYDEFNERLEWIGAKWRQRPSKWASRTIEILTLVVGLGTLAAVVAGGVVAYRQLAAMNANIQQAATLNQLTRDSVQAAKDAAAAARISAEAASVQAKAAADQVRAANRANELAEQTRRENIAASQRVNRALVYVLPTKHFPEPAKIEQLGTMVTITNSGGLPTKGLRLVGNIELLKRQEEPQLRYGEKVSTTVFATLYRNQTTQAPVTKFNPDGSIVSITKEERDALAKGELYLVVYGQITYQDDFGEHWSRFCGWLAFGDGVYRARRCALYNSNGDGQPPQ